MGGVVEGVRVLDFGRYIAGPYCATLLAEFGAEVIRVEKRDGSEDRFVAPVGEGGEGALFLQINRNKKCITLDPMKPEGQEVMRRLVTTADRSEERRVGKECRSGVSTEDENKREKKRSSRSREPTRR